MSAAVTSLLFVLLSHGPAAMPPASCLRGTDGSVTCGYACTRGATGQVSCAQTPAGACATDAWGSVHCFDPRPVSLPANTPRMSCSRGSNGEVACGYACLQGQDGAVRCATTPFGACGRGADGRVVCADPPSSCQH